VLMISIELNFQDFMTLVTYVLNLNLEFKFKFKSSGSCLQ
jgi:hypothetical protein